MGAFDYEHPDGSLPLGLSQTYVFKQGFALKKNKGSPVL